MIQSGGILADLYATTPQVKSFKKSAPDLAQVATEYYVNKGINELKKINQAKVQEQR